MLLFQKLIQQADLQSNPFHQLQTGGLVVFPLDGIGTGLARLGQSSPVTFTYLQKLVEQLKEYGK